MSVLELRGVTQRFGGLVAVSEVDLVVEENQILGLIGPNGAGKTTIFNIVTGIYQPTEGTVYLNGQSIANKKVHEVTRAGIARTFQNIRLFSELSVLDNVKIGMHTRVRSDLVSAALRLPRRGRAERETTQACMDLLKLTGLAKFADDQAGSLPYGSQRRLEIVRAMATGARLLLLDEPAAGMNELETQALMSFIATLKQMDYTIFLIEHDMKLVMNICEKIYVLNYGRIIACGTPEQVRSQKAVIDAYLGEEIE